MKFVNITEGNIGTAFRIQSEAFNGSYDEYAKKVFPIILKSPECTLTIAHLDGNDVGIIGSVDDPICPDSFSLIWVAISPEFQGKGYGLKMVDAFMENCAKDKKNGCTFVLTAASDEQRFYTKLGFNLGPETHEGTRIMTKIVKSS